MPGLFHSILILCAVLLAVALVWIVATPFRLAMAAWSLLALSAPTA